MMIAALVALSRWSSSEFSTPDNQRLIEQSASFQVANQCGNWLIALQGIAPVIHDVAMSIPGLTTAIKHLHHPHATFHHPSSNEAAIGKFTAAIILASRF